jgi:hypothetical protein
MSLAAAPAPTARRACRTKVSPLAQIRLAEQHRARRAQAFGDEGVARRKRVGESERTGGGMHPVGGVDIVFQEDGNAVQ